MVLARVLVWCMLGFRMVHARGFSWCMLGFRWREKQERALKEKQRQEGGKSTKEGMAFDLVLSIFAFLAVAALLGILVYQLMCLSDLEFDYINPYDSASRINASVVPEIAIHVGLSCVYLIFGYWFMFLINLPLIYYHARLYLDHKHLVDVTEIFTSLNREKKYRLVKLAFYILLFFLAIYWLVAAAVRLIVDYEAAEERAAEFSGFHSHI